MAGLTRFEWLVSIWCGWRVLLRGNFFLLFPETKLAILLLFPGQECFIVKKKVFLELLL